SLVRRSADQDTGVRTGGLLAAPGHFRPPCSIQAHATRFVAYALVVVRPVLWPGVVLFSETPTCAGQVRWHVPLRSHPTLAEAIARAVFFAARSAASRSRIARRCLSEAGGA